MSTNIRERLKRFLSEEGVSQKDFAKSIGVSSGYVNAIRSSIQPDKIAKIRALYPNFDADFALPLAGDSMTPLYQPGSIILVKRWQERFIEYGKVYLIITTQGNRMVKYLRAAERNEEVLCVSENSAYDPFTIPREDILALYMVKGCIFQHSL